MANEVINESENATENNAAPISEETNTVDAAAEQPATETAPAAEEPTATTEAAPAQEQSASGEKTAATPAASTEQSAEQSNSGEEDFGKILEKFEQEQTVFHSGELVEGTVVGVSERGVLIDFGYKSEGIAPIEDFTSPTGEVTVQKGDTAEAIIRSISSGDAPPMLSRADAVTRKSWDAVEKAFNDETPITGRVVEVNKGGLRLDINGVEAFLPGSQVDSRPLRNLNSYIGQDIEAKVIKFSRKRGNVVLSRKILTDEVVNAQKAETFANIGEGYIIEGTVKNLTEYGAFVDIGGIDGLLHVTDMSWGRLQNPGDQFKVGDVIQVKVLRLDKQKEKVALGFKHLIPDPWSTVMELYKVNSKVKGKVSTVTEYGAFVELEPGVEGLVHVSEMTWSKRSQSPKRLLHPGDEVEVQVLGIDTVDRRISLGMKQLMPNPWQTVHERYHVGQTVRGKVRNLTEFGAFIELEDGIDGLVHVSDIAHTRKIKHPKDALKRDQEVEAIVRSIDTGNRRMALSIKDTAPSAWDAFVATHKAGNTVRGRISRYAGFGVFVELGNDLEGLCHISELSEDRVERPEDIGAVGQEMDFKILRIEKDTQKIALSHRAVGKEDDLPVDTKSYSTEAKGGMASLGELMNLKRGGSTEEEESRAEQPRMSKKERKALQAQERAEQERLAAERAANGETEQPAETETPEADSSASETAGTPEAATGDASTNAPTEETSTAADNQTETSESNDTVSNESSEENSAETGEANTENASGDTAAEENTATETAETAPVNETDNADGANAGASGAAVEVAEMNGEEAASTNDDSDQTESAKDSEEKTANG